MKKIIIGIVILAILLVIGLVALPSLVPSSVYKDKIESQLTEELGRDVRVVGDIKLSAFPVIKANAGRVEIDNPDGFTAKQFASMAFTLKNPVINLENNAQGQVNWAFGDQKPKTVETEKGPFKRDGRFAAVDPTIGKFSLENGTIVYADAGFLTVQPLSPIRYSGRFDLQWHTGRC